MNINDYLIHQQEVDWSIVLQPWAWLFPEELTLWLVNRFCDLFVVFTDGSVNILRVDTGKLIRLADSRDHFAELIDQGSNAEEWLFRSLVDACVADQKRLMPGQCYAFKILPVLGGSYAVDNIYVATISEYLTFTADIHYQIKDLPDGTKIQIHFGKA